MRKTTFVALMAVLSTGCSDFADIAVNPPEKPVKIAQKSECKGKPTVIAVIDTGFGYGFDGQAKQVKLCQFGHKNFASEAYTDEFHTKDKIPIDNHSHGTNVAGLIDKYAKKAGVNYCLVIIEYFDPFSRGQDNEVNTVKAINYATAIKADFINYSGGGEKSYPDEVAAVKKFLDQGGKFIAAAGNEHSDLEKVPYYPAMDDDRVIVVGNKGAPTSNFGKRVNYVEDGNDVISLGIKLTGTSQAAAITTGKLVGETKNFCK